MFEEKIEDNFVEIHYNQKLPKLYKKSRKNLFEDAHVTPSDKTVIKSFIGAVFFWSILPSETELENMDNSTDNFLIVPSGNAS